MVMKVYYAPASPPSRLVLMTASALGLEVERHQVDLAKGEHMTPEFLKLNPQHAVPVVVDNSLVLNESRAIITYLADKYGKDDSLYPKDIKKRALVNQRLFFDAGTLFQRFADYYYPMYFAGVPLDEEKKKKLDEAFSFLDEFLTQNKWVAGSSYTLADFSIFITVSMTQVAGYDMSNYSKVTTWFAEAKTTLPAQDVVQEGVQAFKGMVDFLTKK